MKRIAAILLTVVMIFSFGGCRKQIKKDSRQNAVKEIVYMIGTNSFKEITPSDLSSFSDYSQLSEECSQYMAIAVGGGYIKTEGNKLSPNGKLSHADARALLTSDEKLVNAIETIPNDDKALTEKELEKLLVEIDSAMTTVTCAQDFFLYTNRVALRNHYADKAHPEWSQYGQTSITVKEREIGMVDELMSNPSKYGSDTIEARIIKTVTLLGDDDARNSKGAEPIKKYFDMIDSAADMKQLLSVCTGITRDTGLNPFFSLRGSNYTATNAYYLYIVNFQNTLFSVCDEPEATYVEKYKALLYELLTKAGVSEDGLEEKISKLLDLHKATVTNEVYDASSEYDTCVLSVDEFDALMPNFGAKDFLNTLGFTADSVMIDNSAAYGIINSYMTDENLDVMKLYYKQMLLTNTGLYLSDDIAQIEYEISYLLTAALRAENGLDPKPFEEYACEYNDISTKETIEYMSNFFGYDVAQAYAQKYVSKETRARIEKITKNIVATFRSRLENNDWLSEETTKYTLEKLDNITINLIAPEYYAHPSSFDSLADAYLSVVAKRLENDIAACNDIERYKTHWVMTADEANACYIADANSINIPAGIVMAPFYSEDMTEAELYGGIGAVIGHELTHGYDKHGSLYDKDGLLMDWFTPADHEAFVQKEQAVMDYYAKWPYRDDKVQSPSACIGETVADLGGLGIVMDYLAGDADAQRTALMQFSYIWADVATPAKLDSNAIVDEHPIKHVRVNAAMATLDEFYKCFDVKEGDAMYVAPEDRVSLW